MVTFCFIVLLLFCIKNNWNSKKSCLHWLFDWYFMIHNKSVGRWRCKHTWYQNCENLVKMFAQIGVKLNAPVVQYITHWRTKLDLDIDKKIFWIQFSHRRTIGKVLYGTSIRSRHLWPKWRYKYLKSALKHTYILLFKRKSQNSLINYL